MGHPQTTVKAFYTKYEKGPAQKCWLWKSSTNGSYGILLIHSGFKNGRRLVKRFYAHRLAYELTMNVKPTRSQVIMHTCDNPLCVNPRHLKLGTQRDNVRDAVNKGRRFQPDVIGNKNGRTKLTEKQVLKIRRSLTSGRQVAAMYNVSPSLISKIRTNQLWRHV